MSKQDVWWVVAMGLAGLLAPWFAAAGEPCLPVQEAKFFSADQADAFGGRLALDGSIAVIGREYGVVEVHERVDGLWFRTAKLEHPKPTGEFGRSLAVCGETILVGAPTDDYATDKAGSVFVYGKDQGIWTLTAKLKALDAAPGDVFGYSVAIDGDLLAIGAWNDDDHGYATGSVYVFARQAGKWEFEAKLNAADAQAEDELGYIVAIDGQTVAAVARGWDVPASYCDGAVYIFEKQGTAWKQADLVLADDAPALTRFGEALELDAGRLVAGALGELDEGVAYVFQRDEVTGKFMQQARLSKQAEGFGQAVALEGDRLFVGARAADDAAENGGAVYVYALTDGIWVELYKFYPPDLFASAHFGDALAVSGSVGLFGVPGEDGPGLKEGSVRSYALNGGPAITAQPADRTERVGTSAKLSVAASGAGPVQYAWHKDGQALVDDGHVSGSQTPTLWIQPVEWADAGLYYALLTDECGEVVTQPARLFVSTHCNPVQQTKVKPPPPVQLYGQAVALDSQTGLVGMSSDDEIVPNGGSVRVIQPVNQEWVEVAKLVPKDLVASAGFGAVVALDGDTAAITAHMTEGSTKKPGRVYIFERSGGIWTETAKIEAADGEGDDYFGFALALEGDTLVVGAHGDNDGGTHSGSVYVFRRAGESWTQTAKLYAADPAENDEFGYAVGLCGDELAAAAPVKSGAVKWAGAVYVFQREGSSWTQTAKLAAAQPTEGAKFGWSVALDDDTIMGGAGDPTAFGQGSALVFERTAGLWQQVAQLRAYDQHGAADFGSALALEGDRAVIGAPLDDGTACGRAYLFERVQGVWLQVNELSAADSKPHNYFGYDVALSGDTALIGAWGDSPVYPPVLEGAAYVFDLAPRYPGDLDCSCGTDAFDIDAFVLALTDPAAYTAQYPECDWLLADLTGDGKVDAFDIDPFVKLLTGR